MELLKIEYQKVQEQNHLKARATEKQSYLIFLLLFVTNVFIVTGQSSDLNLQIIATPNSDNVSSAQEIALLRAAAFLFIISQQIDICYQVVYKLLTCDNLILNNAQIEYYCSELYQIGDIANSFIYSVTFFNWFSRKKLFLICGLFVLSKGIGNCFSFIYGGSDQNLFYNETNYQITVIVSSVLLALIIPVHIKYFQIDPLDKGIICNEYYLIYESQIYNQGGTTGADGDNDSSDNEIGNNHQIQPSPNVRKVTEQNVGETRRTIWNNFIRKFTRNTQKNNFVQQKNIYKPSINQRDEFMYMETLACKETNDQIIVTDEQETEDTILESQLILEYIKAHTGQGMSFNECLNVSGVKKILLAGLLLSMRSALGYSLITNNQKKHDQKHGQPYLVSEVVWFRIAMITSLNLIGYVCMTKFQGRKIKLLYYLIFMVLTYDIAMLAVITQVQGLAEYEYLFLILLKLQFILTQGLLFLIIYLLTIDIGKIALLKNSKKIYGQILGCILSSLYLLNSLVLVFFDKLDDSLSEVATKYVYALLHIVFTVPVIIIFYSQYKRERGEVSSLAEMMTE